MADDNPAAREILVDALRPIARVVDAVGDGGDAIDAVKAHADRDPYDVVFMDWRMPGMDGLEAIRRIKADETIKSPPHMVVVTAFGREEVRAEAEALDVEGFLLKPVTRSTLLDSLVTIYAPETRADAAAAARDAAETTRLRGVRLVLVEDNEINQQVATELLRGAGARVRVAANGRLGVEMLLGCAPEEVPDLVLMDLQMPEMDGFQATARIREEERFRDLPIVAMTAHATHEERERCLAAGMQDHIPKPIDPKVLYDTVARHVPHAGAARAAADADEAPSTDDEAPAGSLPALDAADGLLRVAGNEALYHKLLRQLDRDQADAARQIAAAYTAGDLVTAERHAHTLKGVAGNLGAREVSDLAAQLERALADGAGEGDVHTLIARTGRALERLLAAIRDRLGPEDEVPAAEPPAADAGGDAGDAADWQQLAAAMDRLLADFDAAAEEHLQQHAAVFRARLGADGFAAFSSHLEAFAFAEARDLLARARTASDPDTSEDPA